jgi:hypothetical protein
MHRIEQRRGEANVLGPATAQADGGIRNRELFLTHRVNCHVERNELLWKAHLRVERN